MSTATFNILVERQWVTSHSVIGRLTAGDFACYTLEPPYAPADVKPRAIPAGTYDLHLRYSPKHGRIVPHVDGVPGFQEIEIHWGNYPKDTEGCILVGEMRSEDFIGNSRKAFDELYSRLVEMADAGAELAITLVDQPVLPSESLPEDEVTPDVA